VTLAREIEAIERDFREVSAHFGRDPLHVQGPGGNTSLKLDDAVMLVKASGFLLKDALEQAMFARVAFARVRVALALGDADPLKGSFAVDGPRPSIEASLHALMPQRVVLHTHSLSVLATACLQDAEARLQERLSGVPWAFVPYARPGTPLAQSVRHALAETPDAAVLVLQSHGVVVGADTPEAARLLLEEVCRRLAGPARAVDAAPDLPALAALARHHGLTLPSDPEVHGLALHPRHIALAQQGTLYPDHVVFLGPKVALLDAAIAHVDPAAEASSKLWLVPGKGALLSPNLPAAAQAMARCLAELVALLPDAAPCRYLSAQDEAELLGMEEEKYRQALARHLA
jgi:rhamnose utilization protein RhaD (predicted bifunctional aldolase and dehydrogenase)